MPWKSPEFALATFQHSPSAELLTDAATGAILAANQEFAQLFGHRVDEVVGRTTSELAL